MSHHPGRVLTIETHHAYYRDRFCSGIRLEPTEDCHRVLREEGLLFRESPGGGVVEKRGDNPQPPVRLKRDTAFVFRVLLANPFFWNITDVELESVRPTGVFVFDSGDVSAIDRDGPIIIHSGRLSGQVRLFRKFIEYSPEGSGASTIFVYDRKDRVVSGTILGSEEDRITIDMTGHPEGLYSIRACNYSGAIVREDRVFVTKDTRASTPFGFVVVRPASNISKHHTFRIEFSAREINWTYRINLKGQKLSCHIDATRLKLLNAPVKFLRTLSGTGAERMVEFSSETPIELKEEPYRDIKLIEESEPGKSIVIKTLPSPDVRTLVKDERGLKAIIYLTIESEKDALK